MVCEAIQQAPISAEWQHLLFEALGAHGMTVAITFKFLLAKEDNALRHARAHKYTQYLVNKKGIPPELAEVLEVSFEEIFAILVPLPSAPSSPAAAHRSPSPKGSKRRRSDSTSPVSDNTRKFPQGHLKELNPAHPHFWDYVYHCGRLVAPQRGGSLVCTCQQQLRVDQGYNYYTHLLGACKDVKEVPAFLDKAAAAPLLVSLPSAAQLKLLSTVPEEAIKLLSPDVAAVLRAALLAPVEQGHPPAPDEHAPVADMALHDHVSDANANFLMDPPAPTPR